MNAEGRNGANGGRFPKITDRDLEDLQKRIGVKIENMPEPWLLWFNTFVLIVTSIIFISSQIASKNKDFMKSNKINN